MIPKKIHLCWISEDIYPDSINECINSWKKFLPDFEIIVWNAERAKSINIEWVNQAIKHKKYAFASDYIRFYALYHFGGVYLDSDVEVLKPFHNLLNRRSFIGFESDNYLEAAIIGAEKNTEWVKCCLDYYDGKTFIDQHGKLDLRPLPTIITPIISKYLKTELLDNGNVQNFNSICIFPKEFFCPKSTLTYKIFITENTLTIHHFKSSWYDPMSKAKKWIKQLMPNFILLKFYSIKNRFSD